MACGVRREMVGCCGIWMSGNRVSLTQSREQQQAGVCGKEVAEIREGGPAGVHASTLGV